MKKLKFDGFKMLSKEEMRKIAGGDSGNTCAQIWGTTWCIFEDLYGHTQHGYCENGALGISGCACVATTYYPNYSETASAPGCTILCCD